MALISEVPRGEFLAAIRAVLPHCGKELPGHWLGRLRITGSADGLFVYATDTYTTGVACISLALFGAGELPTFDLSVNNAKIVSAFYRHPADKVLKEQWLAAPLRFETSEGEVTIVEDDALLDGESITLPIGTHPDYPPLAGVLLGRAKAAAKRDLAGDWPRFLQPAFVARFEAACNAYGAAAAFYYGESVLTVQVGDKFTGRIALARMNDDAGREFDDRLVVWGQRAMNVMPVGE